MVDAAIVVVEQTHKKLEEWERTGRKEDYHRVVIDAVKEVGGPSFFALLVIAVSFLPVLTLEAQEGRLFKPLAYTKNLLDDRRGSARDYARPGHAAAVHAHEELQFPAAAGWRAPRMQYWSARSTRRRSTRSAALLMRLYQPVCRVVAALEVDRSLSAPSRW